MLQRTLTRLPAVGPPARARARLRTRFRVAPGTWQTTTSNANANTECDRSAWQVMDGVELLCGGVASRWFCGGDGGRSGDLAGRCSFSRKRYSAGAQVLDAAPLKLKEPEETSAVAFVARSYVKSAPPDVKPYMVPFQNARP